VHGISISGIPEFRASLPRSASSRSWLPRLPKLRSIRQIQRLSGPRVTCSATKLLHSRAGAKGQRHHHRGRSLEDPGNRSVPLTAIPTRVTHCGRALSFSSAFSAVSFYREGSHQPTGETRTRSRPCACLQVELNPVAYRPADRAAEDRCSSGSSVLGRCISIRPVAYVQPKWRSSIRIWKTTAMRFLQQRS
jgi:hypothetical protein